MTEVIFSYGALIMRLLRASCPSPCGPSKACDRSI